MQNTEVRRHPERTWSDISATIVRGCWDNGRSVHLQTPVTACSRLYRAGLFLTSATDPKRHVVLFSLSLSLFWGRRSLRSLSSSGFLFPISGCQPSSLQTAAHGVFPDPALVGGFLQRQLASRNRTKLVPRPPVHYPPRLLSRVRRQARSIKY